MTTRVMLVGGFLGAGKTTLLLNSAARLTARGYRVGLVTNDQGQDLVDTRLLAQAEYPVTEVAGSCFCCAFPDLVEALRRLQEAVQPDVVLAEPVGSCTDLVATVLRPLERYYPAQFELAPLTVTLDATRALSGFSSNVTYLFERQVEEAAIILLNKVDLLAGDAAAQRLDSLAGQYPRKRVIATSARDGHGLDGWLDLLLGQQHQHTETMTVDYARYAEAEAELGWLNAKGMVRSSSPFSARDWTRSLMETLGSSLAAAQIAHIKAHVRTAETAFKVSLTQAGSPLSWDVDGVDLPTEQVDFILNARVGIEPRVLEQVTMDSLDRVKPDALARLYVTHMECFKPLPPRPTYRLT